MCHWSSCICHMWNYKCTAVFHLVPLLIISVTTATRLIFTFLSLFSHYSNSIRSTTLQPATPPPSVRSGAPPASTPDPSSSSSSFSSVPAYSPHNKPYRMAAFTSFALRGRWCNWPHPPCSSPAHAHPPIKRAHTVTSASER